MDLRRYIGLTCPPISAWGISTLVLNFMALIAKVGLTKGKLHNRESSPGLGSWSLC
jgi:hypothetical protein